MKFPVFSLYNRELGCRDEFARDCFLQRRVMCEPDSSIRAPNNARFRAAFSARSAESRRARQQRANPQQYLCRAIFQYRISAMRSRQVVGLKHRDWSPSEVGAQRC